METIAYKSMKAVHYAGFGETDVIQTAEYPMPEPTAGQYIVAVSHAGLNRADLLQRSGHYPPPPGAVAIPGLELSGKIVQKGTGTSRYNIGDKVCCLVAAGAFAEFCAVDEALTLPVPQGIRMAEAACLPECLFTVWDTLFMRGNMTAGKSVFIHGGSSGIGSAAIQLIKAFGGQALVTVGNADKQAFCQKLGADLAINYNQEDFALAVKRFTADRGVDLILDTVGAAYFAANVSCLAMGGMMITISTMLGRTAKLDLLSLMQKRATIAGSTLRAKPLREKALIAAEIERQVWPLIAKGLYNPQIYREYHYREMADAQQLMADSTHTGKIAIRLGD